MVASAFGFALMALCVRLCDDFGGEISSFQKSFFRNLVAVVIALVVFAKEKAEQRSGGGLRTGAVLLLLARSVLGTVGIFANFYALGHIPIAEGQTLNKTAPFFTVLSAYLFLREKIVFHQMMTLLIAFMGVLLIVKPGFAGEAAFPLSMGVLGGVCAGGAYTCVRCLRLRGVGSALVILFFSLFSCMASVPFMAMKFDPMTLQQVLILFGAGVGAALGQFGITLAYGYAAPRDIAVYDYTNILFTSLLGFVFFAQVPDGWSVLGFTAILIAAFRLSR